MSLSIAVRRDVHMTMCVILAEDEDCGTVPVQCLTSQYHDRAIGSTQGQNWRQTGVVTTQHFYDTSWQRRLWHLTSPSGFYIAGKSESESPHYPSLSFYPKNIFHFK